MVVMHMSDDGTPGTVIANFRPHVEYETVHMFVGSCLPSVPFAYVIWDTVQDLYTFGDGVWLPYEKLAEAVRPLPPDPEPVAG